MTKYITCVSGKGGVGKTSSAINLAAALKFFGKDVVIVDCNFTTPNVSINLGMHQNTPTITELLRNKRNHISKATYLHHSGVHVVPANLSLQKIQKTKLENLPYLLDGLAGQYDFVILDAAAGLGREALLSLECADEVLLVTNPELPAVIDALKAGKVAEDYDKPVRGVIVTRAGNSDEMSIENIESIIEQPVISIIPEDIHVRKALAKKQPVVSLYPKSEAAASYKELAAALLGIDYHQYTSTGTTFMEKIANFFGFRKT